MSSNSRRCFCRISMYLDKVIKMQRKGFVRTALRTSSHVEMQQQTTYAYLSAVSFSFMARNSFSRTASHLVRSFISVAS